MLLLAFDGAAPSPALRQRQEAALAAAQAAADTPGSALYRGFPSPLWWLARDLAPGVMPGVGITAEVRVGRIGGPGLGGLVLAVMWMKHAMWSSGSSKQKHWLGLGA